MSFLARMLSVQYQYSAGSSGGSLWRPVFNTGDEPDDRHHKTKATLDAVEQSRWPYTTCVIQVAPIRAWLLESNLTDQSLWLWAGNSTLSVQMRSSLILGATVDPLHSQRMHHDGVQVYACVVYNAFVNGTVRCTVCAIRDHPHQKSQVLLPPNWDCYLFVYMRKIP